MPYEVKNIYAYTLATFLLRSVNAPLFTCLFICSLLLFSEASLPDDSSTIVFVLSGDGGVYTRISQNTIDNITKSCQTDAVRCDELSFVEYTADNVRQSPAHPSLVSVFLGTKAVAVSPDFTNSNLRLRAMLPMPVGKKSTRNHSNNIID